MGAAARNFWRPFKRRVEDKETITKQEASQARALGDDPKTGKPVVVRHGRYGPFVQIGTAEDDEKPRFASLRQGQKPETIALAEALELFRLPRDLGQTPQGEAMLVGIGRYGPYVKYGDRYVSIREDDPYEISAARALELIEEKKLADAKKLIREFPEAGVRVLNGRYGPYVTDGSQNASVPKDKAPSELTLEECKQLIKDAPTRKKTARKARPKKATAKKKSTAKRRAPAKKKARPASTP